MDKPMGKPFCGVVLEKKVELLSSSTFFSINTYLLSKLFTNMIERLKNWMFLRAQWDVTPLLGQKNNTPLGVFRNSYLYHENSKQR
jgi:hypothetical protein